MPNILVIGMICQNNPQLFAHQTWGISFLSITIKIIKHSLHLHVILYLKTLILNKTSYDEAICSN
jgi:hypothetical protein